MAQRIDAIARGAGKCDAGFLNSNYAGTAYKWRKRGYRYGGDSDEPVYEVHPLRTVTLTQLPAYCVVYNDHAWTPQPRPARLLLGPAAQGRCSAQRRQARRRE